jgi:hypothetical protein
LDPVPDGERFVSERDGDAVATIGPNAPPPSITMGEFLAWPRELPRPDRAFADDLASVKALQCVVELVSWPA